MIRKILFFLTLTLTINSFGLNNVLEKYIKADSLLKINNVLEAYKIYKEIIPQIDKKDTLYNYVIWYYISTASTLENIYKWKGDYKNSLSFGLEALKLIKENKKYFNKKFADKEQWMYKNIIVSYFGLEQIDKANKYKKKLYKGYKEKTLPDGIDKCFNFDFFKFKDKNIWGYEWYPELPDDRFSCSFTKVVYYVYSTTNDGSDKDQLYRFHVLMFHQDKKNAEFDYLLERQIETDNASISGSYYQYTYKKDIDYKKLKADVIEILTKEIEPSSKRVIPK
jgi:tetratricopeptide (TPR) repeat protein